MLGFRLTFTRRGSLSANGFVQGFCDERLRKNWCHIELDGLTPFVCHPGLLWGALHYHIGGGRFFLLFRVVGFCFGAW